MLKSITAKFKSLPSKRRHQFKAATIIAGVVAAAILIVVSYASLLGNDSPPSDKPAGKSKQKDPVTKKSDPAKPPAPPQSAETPTDYPSSLLNLSSWKLTLPVGANKKPQEVIQPQLKGFVLAPYFQLAAGGVQFQAPVGGVTTKNSNYSRSELREMNSDGSDEASWSNKSGTHSLTIRQAITHLPAVKNELVAGQIHDASEYIILVRLEGNNLFVEGGGKNVGTLDSNYQLGTQFTVQIIASDGHIRVLYNGAQKVDYARSGSGYYFKAGCYTQSNPSKGDDPNDYGQVIIYDLQLSHL